MHAGNALGVPKVWAWKWGPYLGQGRGQSGDGKWDEEQAGSSPGHRSGRQEGASSPDWVVLGSYWLRAVLGLSGGGKARGVSGLNGESPTLRGLLGTHVQAPGHSA